MSSKRTSTERRKTESHQDDLVDEADRRSEVDHEDLERDSQKLIKEEYRQMMEGDMQERSMDQIPMQLALGNVLPQSMRKTQSDLNASEK